MPTVFQTLYMPTAFQTFYMPTVVQTLHPNAAFLKTGYLAQDIQLRNNAGPVRCLGR